LLLFHLDFHAHRSRHVDLVDQCDQASSQYHPEYPGLVDFYLMQILLLEEKRCRLYHHAFDLPAQPLSGHPCPGRFQKSDQELPQSRSY
jgi:hypothetical protein